MLPEHRLAKRLSCLLIMLVSGCAQFHGEKKKTNYETVVGTPNRDTDLAIKKTRRAEHHMEKGYVEKAEQALQEALVADVSYGPAHNNLGKIFFGQRKLYLAAWEFEYAIRTMPDVPEPHNNLGLVYEEVGKHNEAITYYTIAYEFEPTNPEYIGNLVRARLRIDDRDPLAKPMLEELLMHEQRPHWIRWARELIGLGKLPDSVDYDEYIDVELPEGRRYYEEEDGPELNPPVGNSEKAQRLPPPEPQQQYGNSDSP